ncbi:CopD family protein [Natribacillus halophilus]|uniref:YtkA-like n=1 Tax=Natribacillus halophilus TaxID=549003 RepID=A0A1G8QMY4_9BACI|nr:CopD family protein [Natribacillus halophilus]SDJ06142.1 YtkA-like [Natribacillus halophilus]
MVIIANTVLFITLALFTGIHILEAVPNEQRPKLRIPKFLLSALAIVMIVASFIPIALIAEQTANLSDEPFIAVLASSLFEFTIGQGFVAFVCFLIIVFVARFTVKGREKGRFLLLLPVFGMILATGWSSHAASMSDQGYIFNVIHMTSALSWSGVLFIASFFSIGEDRWLRFFQWFTPFALTMVLLLFVSGIGMVTLITPEYTNSWLLPYGQWQSLKHLLFIPLVFYGFAHGFIMKKRLNDPLKYGNKRKPRFSLQMESMVLVVVFLVTSIMAEQEPPHEVAQTLEFTEVSGFASQAIATDLLSSETVTWSANTPAILMAGAAITILVFFIYSVGTRRPFWLAPIYIALFVFTGHATLMSGADVETTGEGTPEDMDTEPIEVEVMNDTEATVGDEWTLEAEVTQEGDPVEDADYVIFEVWHDEDEQGAMIDGVHVGDGIYEVEYQFQEASTYYVQPHVTARGMHRMPVHEVEVDEQ